VTTTILIMSWDEAHLLRHSLPRATAEEAHVVVIDNACTDDTARIIAEHGAERLHLAERLSYCEALNRAMGQTGGEAVLLLNADCFLEPGFLSAALPHLEDRTVGSVAPRLLRTLGPSAEDRLDAIDAAGLAVDRRRKNTLVGHGRPALAYDRPGEAFGADGAAALYRRATLEHCALDGELFDPDMERWASDVDVAWRARTLGWRCVYEPLSMAYHVRTYSPSTRGRMPARDRRMQFRNRYLMMVKNDTRGALARDLPALVAYELGALAYILAFERELLGGYRDAARLLGRARSRRRQLGDRRRVAGSPPAPLGLEPAP